MADEKKKPDAPATLNAPAGERAAAKAVAAPPPQAYGAEECCIRHFWAVIETDGTLVRGRNVWRTKKLATGQYEVIFTGDVSNGVYNATIGRPGIYTEPTGEICVALRYINPTSTEFNKGVWVDTHDSSGAWKDRAFHLVVHTQ